MPIIDNLTTVASTVNCPDTANHQGRNTIDAQSIEQNVGNVNSLITANVRRDLLARVRGQLGVSKRRPNTPELAEAVERLHKAGQYLSGHCADTVDAQGILQAITAHAALVGVSPSLMAAAPHLTSRDGVEFTA